MTTPERQLEDELIEKFCDLKYEHRPDIRDRAALEKNFRDRFEELNLLCFVQLFIVTNRDSTYYFANNNARHFCFNAD